jgi:hypothetical protein
VQNVTKLVILFALVFSFGCKKEDPEPSPPVITFVDANISSSNSSAIVRFDFLDMDGDLGLYQDENTGEQEHNVFVDYYEKINGVWTLKSPIITYNITLNEYDTLGLNLRFPFLENEAQRTLQGDVMVDLLFNFNADTFRYDIYIKDRAFQKSNVITTSDLITQ